MFDAKGVMYYLQVYSDFFSWILLQSRQNSKGTLNPRINFSIPQMSSVCAVMLEESLSANENVELMTNQMSKSKLSWVVLKESHINSYFMILINTFISIWLRCFDPSESVIYINDLYQHLLQHEVKKCLGSVHSWGSWCWCKSFVQNLSLMLSRLTKC